MKNILSLVITAALLTACGQADNNNSGEEEELSLESIDVDLQAPETSAVNEEVTIKATVTQDDEVVDDADEVIFEIWAEGAKESSEMIEAEHQEEGTYEITKTFDQDNIYHIQSHVTARGIHTMPVVQITVGEPTTEEVEGEHEHEDADNSDDEHHHHSEVTAELDVADDILAHEEQQLSVSLSKDGKALTGANLSLEIKHASESDDSWIELEETSDGEYSGTATFAFTGEYKITIHVRKDDLHEHPEEQITVK